MFSKEKKNEKTDSKHRTDNERTESCVWRPIRKWWSRIYVSEGES